MIPSGQKRSAGWGGLCFPLKLKSIDPLLGTLVMGKIKKHLLPNNLYVLVHIEL